MSEYSGVGLHKFHNISVYSRFNLPNSSFYSGFGLHVGWMFNSCELHELRTTLPTITNYV